MKNEKLDFVLYIVHKTWALQSDVVCVRECGLQNEYLG